MSWIGKNLNLLLFNPVVVRELRQVVRNRAVAYALMLFLLTLVGISAWVLLFVYEPSPLGDISATETYFYALIAAVANFTLAAVLLHSGVRLICERVNDDLMYSSTLRPISFAWGKVAGGIVLSALFYTASLPFFVLLYLFRGVEIAPIFAALFFTFGMVQTLHVILLAFLAGTNSIATAIVRSVFALFVLAVFYFTFFFITALGIDTAFNPGGFLSIGFLEALFFFSIFVVINSILWFFLALPQFAPPESNRMFITRCAATLLVLGTYGWALAMCRYGPEPLFTWVGFAQFPLGLLCVLAVHERGTYGVRLRRGIPKTPFWRLVAFPLFTGDLNALIWLGVVIILTTTLPLLAYSLGPKHYDYFLPMFSSIYMCYTYAVLSLFLWKRVFYRWLSKEWIWHITVGLLIIATLVSVFLSTTLFRFRPYGSPELLFLPLGMVNDLKWAQLGFAMLTFGISLAYVVLNTILRYKSFTPPTPEEFAAYHPPEEKPFLAETVFGEEPQ